MFNYIKQDGNAPLIYVILRLWATIFGFSDLSYRVLALIISAAIVPVSYILFRDWLGKARAAQIAILLSICAPSVRFSTLARGYGLLPLLSLISTYQVIRFLDSADHQNGTDDQNGTDHQNGTNDQNRGGRRHASPLGSAFHSALYVLTLTSTVYLHHWGAVLGIAHGILATFGAIRKWWTWQRFFHWFKLAIIAALLYAPWAVILIYQLKSDTSPWILRPRWDEIVFYTPVEALAGYKDTPQWAHDVNMLWSDILFWTCMFISVTLPTKPAFATSRWQIIGGGGILTAALISQIKSLWRDRYLVTFTPMLLILQAIVLTHLAKRLPRWFALALPILVWLPLWSNQLWFYHRYPESSAWILAEQIGKQANPQKDLVVVSFEAIAPQIDRYLPKNVPMVTYPDIERLHVIRWAGINSRIRDENKLHQLIDKMETTLKAGGNIWLVESVHNFIPTELDEPMGDLNFNVVETLRMCQIRSWLLDHSHKEKNDLWAPGREFPIMASRFSLDPKGSNPPQR